MEENKVAQSQLSEESSALDLSFTYGRKEVLIPKVKNNESRNEISGFGRLFESLPCSSMQVDGKSMASLESTIEGSVEDFPKSRPQTKNKSGPSHNLTGNSLPPSFYSFNCNMFSTGDVKMCEANPRIRKLLDVFYQEYSQKKPSDEDICSKTALEHLSVRISDVTKRNGHRYGLRSLQMAHIILNRDECEVLKTSSKTANFSALSPKFENGKIIPGLSEHVLRDLLKEKNTLIS
ncbi:shieldin complex subunit 1 [Ambystoma mexicanum]|uniref:shieldin complex subunit 1 n=1 Tax=Ambystoma mexicanum TaxID=8296 RepID=UPI0037E8065A